MRPCSAIRAMAWSRAWVSPVLTVTKASRSRRSGRRTASLRTRSGPSAEMMRTRIPLGTRCQRRRSSGADGRAVDVSIRPMIGTVHPAPPGLSAHVRAEAVSAGRPSSGGQRAEDVLVGQVVRALDDGCGARPAGPIGVPGVDATEAVHHVAAHAVGAGDHQRPGDVPAGPVGEVGGILAVLGAEAVEAAEAVEHVAPRLSFKLLEVLGQGAFARVYLAEE